MSVYFIVRYEVDDPEAFEAYQQGVTPLLMKHGAELLVADFEAKVLEGQSGGTNVVLKFESEEAAMNFYNDPEYAPFKQLRLDTTSNGNIILAKEFILPSE